MSRRERLRGRRWMRLRAYVLARDGYLCRLCGRGNRKLEIDHIKPLAAGGGDEPGNLRSLCQPCHVGRCHDPDPEKAAWKALLDERYGPLA